VSDPSEPEVERAFDSARFRQVLGHFPTGVTVVTAVNGEKPVGLAVGSFTSVSLEPPLVAFCPAKTSSSWPKIREAGSFCVNILAEDQEDVCRVFASKAEDKFEGLGWRKGTKGLPVLTDVLAWIVCEIETVHDAGDHDVVIGRVIELEVEQESGPLIFYRGGYGRFTP
jgi:flavin reductase (DIM6/NTAB) family NADH-FMN oxidoreductase RutF